MSYRQDKLILLIETGTSSQVRRTAAKQLAELTLKTFRAGLPSAKDEFEQKPQLDGGNEADGRVVLAARVDEDDAWTDVLAIISKLLPILKSKTSEARHASAYALGLLAGSLPPYEPKHPIASSSTTAPIDFASLLRNGNLLLASAGREYVAKIPAGDKAKRRKAMMGSLGLGDAVGWGDDVDKVIGEDDDDMKIDEKEAKTPSAEEPPENIFEGLSSRQIMMLKRKKGNIAEEARKLRRLSQINTGSSGTSAAPSPSVETPVSGFPDAANSDNGPVIIDPGAKVRAVAASGGAVEVSMDDFDDEGNPISAPSKPTLSLHPSQTPWSMILFHLLPWLTDPVWQTRHGSALGIMEILRFASPYIDGFLLFDTARSLLTLLALDRFGDFLGDTVIAPVRETAAQTLGVLFKSLGFGATQEVHEGLMLMIMQPWAKRGKEAAGLEKGEKFAWEVRHAGMLGLKYEVAVRIGLGAKTEIEEEIKPDLEAKDEEMPEVTDLDLLKDVVGATKVALRDADDDVKTVAASALLPVTDIVVTASTEIELSDLLDTLWACLEGGVDDLGSSVGAVMDLLCALLRHDRTMEIMSSDSGPRDKIKSIYPFIRHPISSVRLSVANALHVFATDPRLGREDWMHDDFLCFLYQNLILEERADIRDLSLAALTAALVELEENGCFETAEDLLGDWYAMIMSPMRLAMDPTLFRKIPGGNGGHDIDKKVMAGDLALSMIESTLDRRISAAKALAVFRRLDSEEDVQYLTRYLNSGSAHQIFYACAIIQEWAGSQSSEMIGESEEVESLVTKLTTRIELPPLASYSEMSFKLRGISAACHDLLNAFVLEGKVSKNKVPTLPDKIDASGQGRGVFSTTTAQNVVGILFDDLASSLSPQARNSVLPTLEARRRKIMVMIGYLSVMKDRNDLTVQASVAGALIAMGRLPTKFGSVVKAVMDAVRNEELEVLQVRSAGFVARFVQHCSSPLFNGKVNPSDKIIRNLLTFLCQDTNQTPVFKNDAASKDGILALVETAETGKKKGQGGQDDFEETEAQISMRVSRRGALLAFESLARTFGSELFDKVPRLWLGLSEALTQAGQPGLDERLANDIQAGQDLIDCLSSITHIAPFIDSALHPRLATLLSPLIAVLSTTFANIRNCAAQALSVLCEVMLDESMRRVVDEVVPMVGDARSVNARRGAVETIHYIIKRLDLAALPYVLFLIVPILGRMSDPDEPTRLLATSTFASLVKMVPLEAGIPDPPGFSPELLAKRDEERNFLMQLLDGSKAEQYQIPVQINAELRQYQKEGVSWLAFLAKYQLHGILCDDMGLGKSIQTICIIGSKIYERSQKHSISQAVESQHLPSLIVCPPSLIGHWYHEITTYCPSLRPLQYTGQSSERSTYRRSLLSYDVVISSYDTVRADIDFLSTIDWLYCVLDEGHIIKNAKTKLASAVKGLRAQHRLVLSGTPIQNNVLELWSLFDFLMPGFLGSERMFSDRFSKPILADRDGKATPKQRDQAAAALEALHKQVLPFLLRRLKEDVLHDLPPKIIQDYYCELSPVQQMLYEDFSRSRAAQEAGEEIEGELAGQAHVFQSLQYLRKLCNHPALVLDKRDAGQWGEVTRKVGTKLPPPHDISHSPKLEALRQLLTDCGIGLSSSDKLGASADDYSQHRVLIFCQLRDMLDLIENDLFKALMPSVSYMRLDGTVDPRKRHAVVQTFNSDPRIDVLLLTTSVGGLGLNLTGADTVIFVDHDWNPMKDLQAMDRAHRLGQKKVVNVYRLITKGTLEEKIMGLQRFKMNIASSVVTQQNAALGSMNTGEVLDLFKISSEPAGSSKPVKPTGSTSASKVLEGLEDLPPEEEYAELSLSNFMSKV